ncbi:MAG TPA: ATP-dependent nuclease subunit B, partial [Opitutaceae bacterium]|nr:ATP-dependent nuclease subunit B [Opitutaceae bacterium]
MVPPPLTARRHFISWDRPLLPQAVAFLAGEWKGDGPLDLSTLLVVVPTQQSGRRLREALAEHAAARGQAAFPPRVFTPDRLITQGLGPDVAARLESLLAWTEILRPLDLEAFRDVFPVDPPARDFNWALRLAREFTHLQA